MSHLIGRQALALALVVIIGCGDDSKSAGAQMKDATHDAAQGAKDVGKKVGTELSEALASLEHWAKETASDVGESSEAFAKRVQDKMPDTEKLVSDTKAQLAAGGAKAKELAARLDEKLAVLKEKLAAVAHNAASATKEMKDDVVVAYNDLLADVRSALKPAAG
jgi:ABC-type transporter Mla subunit MlaD